MSLAGKTFVLNETLDFTELNGDSTYVISSSNFIKWNDVSYKQLIIISKWQMRYGDNTSVYTTNGGWISESARTITILTDTYSEDGFPTNFETWLLANSTAYVSEVETITDSNGAVHHFRDDRFSTVNGKLCVSYKKEVD